MRSTACCTRTEERGRRIHERAILVTWHDHVVNDYRVAAHGPRLGSLLGREPEGKQHAYLDGADNTACGFGLNAMRVFEQLRFSLQPPSLKCPICKRIVAADH